MPRSSEGTQLQRHREGPLAEAVPKHGGAGQRGRCVGAGVHAVRERGLGSGAATSRITFDDGPGPYTPAVLSVLEANHVQATFFEIGKMLRYFGPSTEREIRDGDVIGDHTQTHPMMAQLPAREQREQLFEPLARIEILGGPRPTLFRPPYGSFNATTFHELRSLHLLMVLWSTDTDDYEQPGVAAIVQKAWKAPIRGRSS